MSVEIPKWVLDEWARAIDQRILEEVIEEMSQKRIYCYSHGPLLYPGCLVPWEDVWLRWKGKPGRTVYHAAPCLECSAELEAEIKLHQLIRETNETARDENWYASDDAHYGRVLDALKTQEFVSSGEGAALTITTTARGISRQHAERMMAWWLEQEYGIKNPKFVWNKPEIVILPHGFGEYK
mgnify:FL=1